MTRLLSLLGDSMKAAMVTGVQLALLGSLLAGCGGSPCGDGNAIRLKFTRPYLLRYSGTIAVAGRTIPLRDCPGGAMVDGWGAGCGPHSISVNGYGLKIEGASQAVVTLIGADGAVLARAVVVPLGPAHLQGHDTLQCERVGMLTLEIPEPPTAPPLTLAPGSADFGQVAVGTSASATFTLMNPGRELTGFPVFSVTGGDFVVSQQRCTERLPAGGSCTAQITFLPTAVGARTGMLLVTATPGGSTSAALAGEGVVPRPPALD